MVHRSIVVRSRMRSTTCTTLLYSVFSETRARCGARPCSIRFPLSHHPGMASMKVGAAQRNLNQVGATHLGPRSLHSRTLRSTQTRVDTPPSLALYVPPSCRVRRWPGACDRSRPWQVGSSNKQLSLGSVNLSILYLLTRPWPAPRGTARAAWRVKRNEFGSLRK